MSKLRQLLTYHFQGLGTKKIKLMTGVSRNTVKRYLRQLHAMQLSSEAVLGMSDQVLDDLFRSEPVQQPMDRMEVLFKYFDEKSSRLRKRGVTLLQLWHEYMLLHPDGFQQTSYYHYYNIWKKKMDPSMHMEHKAGDKLFIDFAGEKLKIVDLQTGEIKQVEVFVAILGASQLTYVEAVDSQKVEDFIGGCENALHYFGGVPEAVVPDNLKSAVIKAHKYEPWLNENFEIFANHYGMAVLPARSRKPKDKALVEGAVKIAYQRIYAKIHDQTFHSIAELNATILTHLQTHNNKSFQGRTYSRRQQFEEMEKAELKELPKMRFEMYKSVFVTVMKNSHVSLTTDKHYYSAPYNYIGKKVKLMFSRSVVRIFYRYELIAEHPRIKSPHNYSTIKEHLPGEQRHMLEWNPEKFLNEAKAIHPDVEYYISQVLLNKQHPEQAYRSCQGILSFAKRIGKERLVKACKRAHEVGWYNYRTIENILKKGLDREAVEESSITMPAHDNIRGKDYYC